MDQSGSETGHGGVNSVQNRLAVITGASSGIGHELARIAARHGNDLVIASDEDAIHTVAEELRTSAISVQAVKADLGSKTGLETLIKAIGIRTPDILMANAGMGLGGQFLDNEFGEMKPIIDLNVTGTIALIHDTGRKMRVAGSGRILITGSIVDDIPGPYNLLYNASKAFIDNFGFGLREELKDSGVTVTCLMPGLTDTDFFERADMTDTMIGQTKLKDDPADVAADGYRAMMAGEAGVIGGNFLNQVQSVFSELLPDPVLAAMHKKIAEPR